GAPASAASLKGAAPRIQSRPGQVPARRDGPDRERAAAAAGPGRARDRGGDHGGRRRRRDPHGAASGGGRAVVGARVIPLALLGAAGRMGRAGARAVGESSGFQVRVRIERPERIPPPPARGAGEAWSDSPEAIAAGDVVVDFSAGPGTRAAARVCAARGAALVSGTTGLDPATDDELKAAARRGAGLRAANFSLGIAALRRALGETLGAVPASWDIEIIERHHRGKVDCPSGTALELARDAAARRGLEGEALRFGRQGRVGPRPAGEIGVHAVRGGTWVGDHAVLLAGEGGWIEPRHVASPRQALARAAPPAPRYMATAPPGSYTMDDVLGQRR